MKKSIAFIPFLFIILLSGFQTKRQDSLKGAVFSAVRLMPLQGVSISINHRNVSTTTDKDGRFEIARPPAGSVIEFRLQGYGPQEITYAGQKRLDVRLIKLPFRLDMREASVHTATRIALEGLPTTHWTLPYSESYASVEENRFVNPRTNPLSTFGIDVDVAAYSNVRRFINQGQLPPADAVRVEEMINYFKYAYPAPEVGEPFSISTELSTAPWNSRHRLLRIGLQTREVEASRIPQSNLTLLVDVSGSMSAHNKLPLVKSSLKMLVNQLRTTDKVSIVTYAGSANVVLKPTSGKYKREILNSINDLKAGGSTAGEAGIKLAYELAMSNFIKSGNNRVIIASDGDFNTGQSSDLEMLRLIEEKRKSGIYLSVLGFGMGNYKDSKMELLADKGNGNYAYIDNFSEGRRVLVTELGGTVFTVANDVKLQLEFNPSKVQAYRLIGYENRALKHEDFNNDLKDAGELGSGHTVTALYEIIPPGVKSTFTDSIDDLKYQSIKADRSDHSNELVNVKVRFKEPGGTQSRQLIRAIEDNTIPLYRSSSDFRFAAAVAGYGMLLKKSDFVPGYTYDLVADLAAKAISKDEEGFRSEFVRLVRASSLLAEDLLTLTEN